jgi:hypothetical protein
MADREQPLGGGKREKPVYFITPAYRPQVKKRQSYLFEPKVRVRQEPPDALAGHLRPVGHFP